MNNRRVFIIRNGDNFNGWINGQKGFGCIYVHQNQERVTFRTFNNHYSVDLILETKENATEQLVRAFNEQLTEAS